MKTLVTLAAILLFTITGWAQGPVRRADTLQQVLAIDPTKVALGKLSYLVMGRTNVTDGELLLVDFDPTNNLAADNITIFTNVIASGRWVIRPILASSPLTFQAGTNMSVLVTNNTVTYSYSGTPSLLIDGLPVTEFLDNGYVNFDNGGSGTQFSLYLGDDTVSTNKINSTFYNWVLSLAGGGGGTTNGLGVNGTFRTDWNAISSAEIAYTVSAGTNWYGSLVAGSVAANKLATTGTGTSTNFLAGDYSYKQVTTNMIPGLNAVLATIGTGGSGGESNTASNLGTPSATNQGWYASKSGVDLQFRSLQIGPNLTLTSNANSIRLDVTLSTNSGTVVSVDGGSSLATVNFADSTGIAASLSTTNASFALVDRDFGDLTVSSSGTVMTIDNNVITSNKVAAANITQDKLGTSGTGLSTNFLAGDYSYKQVTTNMIPGLNAILATIGTGGGSGTGSVVTANGGSDMSRANITTNGFGLLVTQSGTNILLSTTNNYPVDYYAGGFLPLFAGLSNALTGDLHYKQSSDIRSPMWESGTGWNAMGMRASGGVWSVAEYNTNDFTVLESFITIDPTDLTGPTDIITFPNSGFNNKVVFEADVELNGNVIAGTQTLGTSNTTVATTAFVLQNAGGGSGSDTNWNGNPIASGTITNLTTAGITMDGQTRTNWSTAFAFFQESHFSASDSFGSQFGTWPWSTIALSGGTITRVDALAGGSHPGIYRPNSGANANGGMAVRLGVNNQFLVTSNLIDEVVFRIEGTNEIFHAMGWSDAITAADPVDCLETTIGRGADYNLLEGRARSNSSETVTSDGYRVSLSTWYRRTIEVNGDATEATFRLYSGDSYPGTLLWSNTVSANLPTGSGRVLGHGTIHWKTSSGSSTALMLLDYIAVADGEGKKKKSW